MSWMDNNLLSTRKTDSPDSKIVDDFAKNRKNILHIVFSKRVLSKFFVPIHRKKDVLEEQQPELGLEYEKKRNNFFFSLAKTKL